MLADNDAILIFSCPKTRIVAAVQKPSCLLIMQKKRSLKAMLFYVTRTIKSYLNMQCPTQVNDSEILSWVRFYTIQNTSNLHVKADFAFPMKYS